MDLKWSFLVPSRIYALARPGVVGGQTRPNVVCSRVHGSTTASLADPYGDRPHRGNRSEARQPLGDGSVTSFPEAPPPPTTMLLL